MCLFERSQIPEYRYVCLITYFTLSKLYSLDVSSRTNMGEQGMIRNLEYWKLRRHIAAPATEFRTSIKKETWGHGNLALKDYFDVWRVATDKSMYIIFTTWCFTRLRHTHSFSVHVLYVTVAKYIAGLISCLRECVGQNSRGYE